MDDDDGGAMPGLTLTFEIEDDDGDLQPVELPARYVVCSRCEGTGSHVHPDVDGSGITSEQFDGDPDFREDYFAGRYDVRCYECKGQRVELAPDEDRINADPELKRLYREYQQQQHEAAMDARVAEMERRMGA